MFRLANVLLSLDWVEDESQNPSKSKTRLCRKATDVTVTVFDDAFFVFAFSTRCLEFSLSTANQPHWLHLT